MKPKGEKIAVNAKRISYKVAPKKPKELTTQYQFYLATQAMLDGDYQAFTSLLIQDHKVATFKNRYGDTLAHFAFMHNLNDFSLILQSNFGEELFAIKNNFGFTPKDLTKLMPVSTAFKVLLRAMRNDNVNTFTRIAKAVFTKIPHLFYLFDEQGKTLVDYALDYGFDEKNLEIFSRIVELIPGAFAANSDGDHTQEALAEAFDIAHNYIRAGQHQKLIEFLCECKFLAALTNYQDHHGDTLVHKAVIFRQAEAFTWLCKKNPQVLEQPNNYNQTSISLLNKLPAIKIFANARKMACKGKETAVVKFVSVMPQIQELKDEDGKTLFENLQQSYMKPKPKKMAPSKKAEQPKKQSAVYHNPANGMGEDNTEAYNPDNFNNNNLVVDDQEPTPPSWDLFQKQKDAAMSLKKTENAYVTAKLHQRDIDIVCGNYNLDPASGYGIRKIEVIYNPALNMGFAANLAMLQLRAGNKAFAPNWDQDGYGQHRKTVDDLRQQMADPNKDPSCPDIKIIPGWHAGNSKHAESLFSAGFGLKGKTDDGFFGSGFYMADNARYPFTVYHNGLLIFVWTCHYAAYPVVKGDMKKLKGKGAYGHYDANFIPVVPASDHPLEANFYPTKPGQKHVNIEMVFFNGGQIIPRYRVYLATTKALKKLPPLLPDGYQKKQAEKPKVEVINDASDHGIDNADAAQYLYDNYLSKPYDLKVIDGVDWTKMDWEYVCEKTGTVVPRPNHGEVHALCSAALVDMVTQAYIDHNKHKLTDDTMKALREGVPSRRVGMMYFVSGRRCELFYDENKPEQTLTYTEFRQSSAKAFRQYFLKGNSKISPPEAKVVYQMILTTFSKKSPENDIAATIHELLLVRCKDQAEFKKKCKDIDARIGKQNRVRLVKLAIALLKACGNRIMGDDVNVGWYDNDLFVKCSLDPKYCMEQIEHAKANSIGHSIILASYDPVGFFGGTGGKDKGQHSKDQLQHDVSQEQGVVPSEILDQIYKIKHKCFMTFNNGQIKIGHMSGVGGPLHYKAGTLTVGKVKNKQGGVVYKKLKLLPNSNYKIVSWEDLQGNKYWLQDNVEVNGLK